MTGTSMDGIDISFCATDGLKKIKIFYEKSYNYSLNNQYKLKEIKFKNINKGALIKKNDIKVTKIIIFYIKKFLKQFDISNKNIDFIVISEAEISFCALSASLNTDEIKNDSVNTDFFNLFLEFIKITNGINILLII